MSNGVNRFMSKYESRSAEIKEDFAKLGIKVSWAFRRGRLYFVVKFDDKLVFENGFARAARYLDITSRTEHWYPGASITSWGPNRGTFFVKDVMEILRR